jgi:hypothetical protein
MKIGCGPRSRVNVIKIRGGRGAYLYEDKRVRLDGFEELTEYVVHERYQILVRLIFGKRLLIREDGPEQIQGGYLAEHSERVQRPSPHT